MRQKQSGDCVQNSGKMMATQTRLVKMWEGAGFETYFEGKTNRFADKLDVGYAEWKRWGKVDPKVFGLVTGRMALLFAQQDGSAHPKLWAPPPWLRALSGCQDSLFRKDLEGSGQGPPVGP